MCADYLIRQYGLKVTVVKKELTNYTAFMDCAKHCAKLMNMLRSREWMTQFSDADISRIIVMDKTVFHVVYCRYIFWNKMTGSACHKCAFLLPCL
jgi:hypothetical protein